MDSKVVNKAIDAQVWGPLKALGFEKRTSRAAWRFHDERTDVVIFRSFNAYNAAVMGVTTYSFWIELGCYLKYLPPSVATFGKNPRAPDLPKPEECKLRARLQPRPARKARGLTEKLAQALKRSRRVDRSIWRVTAQPAKLGPLIEEARDVLLDDGMRWFEQFKTARDVFMLLREREEDMNALWGFGRPGSPARHYILGYAARRAGLQTKAREHLLAAASTSSYIDDAARLRADAATPG